MKWSEYVSLPRLMENVTHITQHERIAGTPQERATFDWIKQTLEGFGATATLYEHDAFISVPVSSSLTVEGKSFFCRTHSHVISTGPQGVTAPLCFVEQAKLITPDTACGFMVVLRGRAEREPLIKAEACGAVGVIFVSGENIHESCVTPVWGSPSHEELHLRPAIPVVSITDDTAERLLFMTNQAQHGKPTLATLVTEVDSGWRVIPLLEVEVKAGTKVTDEFVMLSGHVCSWYEGATDNGTANSVMMEVCRVAAEHRNTLERNVRVVFFSGHSQGRYAGSSWYFDSHWEDIHEHCVASVNADVLGGVGASDVTRSTIMPELKPLAALVIKELTGADFKGARYGRAADQSFWGCGVSCAFASFSKQPKPTDGSKPRGANPDLGWWWHTPHDTLDKISPENFLRDAQVFVSVVMELAASKVWPLDFRLAADEAIANLTRWQEKAGTLFDLALPLERAQALRAALETLYANAPDAQADVARIQAFHAVLWKVGRELVLVNYTRGHAYLNDPAAAQPPMPALRHVDALVAANVAADADVAKAVQVALVRGRTYVAHALRTALCAVKG